MKNLIIVDSYHTNRQTVLIECLTQLKKSGYDIMLTTNSKELSADIIALCNYCVYTDDNTLLSIENSPSCWFADHEDYITINGKAATYVIVKKLALGLSMAKTMGYTNFLFTEYDCIIHDDDLPKITALFEKLDEKKAVFFHFWDDGFPVSETNPVGFETLIFAGNVDFFIDTMKLPTTYAQWLASERYTLGHHALEYKFPVIFQNEMDNIHLITDKKSPTYFTNSNMDLFSNRYDVHLVTDLDSVTGAVLLIIGNNSRITISLNGEIKFDSVTPKNEWRKLYFDITTPVAVSIKTADKLTEYTVTQENLSTYSTGTKKNFVKI